MKIDSFDHIDIDATCEFYTKALGMEVVTFNQNRKALSFESQKINLQQLGRESSLIADRPTPGSADVCFVTCVALSDVIAHLKLCNVNRSPAR